jgi:hypothetical protein
VQRATGAAMTAGRTKRDRQIIAQPPSEQRNLIRISKKLIYGI